MSGLQLVTQKRLAITIGAVSVCGAVFTVFRKGLGFDQLFYYTLLFILICAFIACREQPQS